MSISVFSHAAAGKDTSRDALRSTCIQSEADRGTQLALLYHSVTGEYQGASSVPPPPPPPPPPLLSSTRRGSPTTHTISNAWIICRWPTLASTDVCTMAVLPMSGSLRWRSRAVSSIMAASAPRISCESGPAMAERHSATAPAKVLSVRSCSLMKGLGTGRMAPPSESTLTTKVASHPPILAYVTPSKATHCAKQSRRYDAAAASSLLLVLLLFATRMRTSYVSAASLVMRSGARRCWSPLVKPGLVRSLPGLVRATRLSWRCSRSDGKEKASSCVRSCDAEDMFFLVGIFFLSCVCLRCCLSTIDSEDATCFRVEAFCFSIVLRLAIIHGPLQSRTQSTRVVSSR